jgi:signal transduction histidine kinase
MTRLHALTTAYVFLLGAASRATVAPGDVAILLGYGALLLGTELVPHRWARALLHAVGGAAAVAALPWVQAAVLLLPFHVLGFVASWSRRTFPAFVAVLLLCGVAARFFIARWSATFAEATWSDGVAFVLWSAGVYAVHELLARAQERAGTLDRQLLAAGREVARLSRSVEQNVAVAKIEKETARLQERRSLSVALHDRLGHAVTGSILKLEEARHALECDPPDSARVIAQVESMLREGMDQMRHALRARKPAADAVGLRELERAVYEFDRDSRFSAGLEVAGDPAAINAELWRVMIANLQEALTNCRKHSNGDQVTVSVKVLNKLIRFEVKDNGRTTRSYVVPGVGLEGLEERTAAAGGTLILDSTRGFSVVALWRRDEHPH